MFAEEEIRLKGLPGGEGGGGWGVVGASYNVITATSSGSPACPRWSSPQVLPLNSGVHYGHMGTRTHTRLGADLGLCVIKC